MLLKKIVIAEDDDAIAHMVNMALGDAGYLCLRAETGHDAIKLVRVHTPDLLILDVMMPGMDGLEVARTLRADVILSKTPILMLTALSTVENKIEGLEAGADDYVVKPFDLRELAARVKALIRASKRESDRNPTTSLPGSHAIEMHLDKVLAGDDSSAVLHFDVCQFDQYADYVGFSRVEQLVAELGHLVLDRVRAHAEIGAFVGHLGGVDFIAVTTTNEAETVAQEVIDRYEERRRAWVDDPGSATGETAKKAAKHVSELNMAIAVVPTEGLGAQNSGELAERMASAMRASKRGEGSNYVVWKPEAA